MHTEIAQTAGCRRREGHRTISRRQQRGERHADLHTGKKAVGVSGQPGDGGTTAALHGQPPHLAVAQRDQRNFGGHKDCFDQHEQQDDGDVEPDLHAGQAIGLAAAGPCSGSSSHRLTSAVGSHADEFATGCRDRRIHPVTTHAVHGDGRRPPEPSSSQPSQDNGRDDGADGVAQRGRPMRQLREHQDAARAKHPDELTDISRRGLRRHVLKHHRRVAEVERCITKRQRARRVHQVRHTFAVGVFAARAVDHRLRDVDASHRSEVCGQRLRQPAKPAAEVERCVGAHHQRLTSAMVRSISARPPAKNGSSAQSP